MQILDRGRINLNKETMNFISSKLFVEYISYRFSKQFIIMRKYIKCEEVFDTEKFQYFV